jgi:hypothetical protein
MISQLPIGKEAKNFLNACELIHALLAREPLTSEDRDVIVLSANELLNKLRLA